MKSQEFYKELAQGKIAPYYYLHGEELLAQEACDQLIEKALEGGERILNLQVFYAGESEPPQIINCALEFPFLSKRRVVIVKQAEKLKSKEQELYLSYLSAPALQTCLIFWAWEQRGKKELNEPLPKFVNQNRHLFLFDSPDERGILSWIKARVEEKGYTITPEAAEFLRRNHEELLPLKNEIEKVLLFAGAETTITLSHVEAAAVDYREADVYEYTRALGKGDYVGAESILKKVLPRSSDKELLMFLGTVLWQLRRMIKVKELVDEGVRPELIAKKIWMNPAEAQRLAADVKEIPWRNLHACLQEAAEADSLWKRGELQPPWALSFLAFRRGFARR